jgi:SAM-dependent methyltransferase
MVLDVGCGEARLARYLDLERLAYRGFDISPTAVDRGRAMLRRGEVFECSIQAFAPEDGRCFEAIVFKGSLPSIDDPLGEIERYLNFLSTAGIIIVSLYVNPNEDGNSSLLARFLDAACTTGRFRLIERADTISITYSRAWRLFVIGR